jgi:hypothetical protein
MKVKGILGISILLITSLFILSGCDSQTASKIKDAVENLNPTTAKETYVEASQGLSKARKEKLNKEVSKVLVAYLQTGYEEVKKNKSKEASFYNKLTEVEDIGISDKTLQKTVKNYETKLEGQSAKVDGNNNEDSSSDKGVTTQESSQLSPDELDYVNKLNAYVQDYNKAVGILKNLIYKPDTYKGDAWGYQLKSEGLAIKLEALKLKDMEQTVPNKYEHVHQLTEEAFLLLADSYSNLEDASQKSGKQDVQAVIDESLKSLSEGNTKLQEAITETEKTYGASN